MKLTGQLIEFRATEDLRAELAALLAREGAILAHGDVSNAFAISNDLSRRATAARDLALAILAIIEHRGTKSLDVEVLEAGHRLALTNRP
jgi:hypothetical protein